jgi:hypothetical protein
LQERSNPLAKPFHHHYHHPSPVRALVWMW